MSTTAREEFLEDDPEITGQKFCLLSFLSPEKVLSNKDVFFFSRFVEQYEFALRVKGLEQYMVKTIQSINTKLDEHASKFDAMDLSGVADTCRNSRVRIDTVMDGLQTFIKENQTEMKETKLKESYEDWLFNSRAKLEEEFLAKNNFQTTVRGLKVRGIFSSQGEAEARSKKMQRMDPLHNIFLGEVGKWLPWDPAPTEVSSQEYAEDQLNTLMKKYKENEDAREMFMRENRQKGGAKAVSVSRPSEGGVNEMFGSAPDLALQRKMEAAEAKKE